MALTSARDILNKKILGTGGVPSADEIPIDIAGLSATKLSVGLEEIVLDINQLSSSILAIGEKVENATEYSTTEKIVGKWIDGSDIYEKTFHNDSTILLTASDWTNAISFVDASSIDLLIDYEVIRTIGATSTYGYLQCALSANKAFNIFNARNLAVEIDTITLRYTKTAAESSKKRTTKKK